MRIIVFMILFSLVFSHLNGQTSKPIYLGKGSWQKVNDQKKPEILTFEKNVFNMNMVTQIDSQNTYLVRKVNPGTITLREGPTIPVSESLKIKGKKLASPQIIPAPPLQIRDNAEFNVNYTDKKHGFPALAAYDFAEDDEHNMWIATEKGVISYDGYNYRYYSRHTENSIELTESSILFDHQKRLWVATNNGLYFFKNDSIFTIEHSTIDFSVIDCKEVILDAFNRIWIPTKSYGAICIDDKTIKVYDKRCGLPNNFVEAMYVDKKGTLFMASRENGIVVINQERMRALFNQRKDMRYNNFLSFMEDDKGIWAGSFQAGLFRITATDTLRYTFNNRYTDVILDLKKGHRGLWISCYGNSLIYLSDKSFLKINESNGLLNRLPMRSYVDSYENVWVSNISGFSRVNDNSIYLDQFSNRALGHMKNIFPDTKGNGQWMISFGKNLIYRKENKATTYTYRTPNGIYPFNYLTSGTLNKDGSLWIGTYGEGIVHATKNIFTRYKYSNFIDHLVLQSIKTDADNNIWFCPLRFGLIVYKNKQLLHYTQKEGLLFDDVVNLLDDKDQIMHWVFAQGIQRFKNEKIETFYLNNKPFQGKVNEIIQLDNKHTLWATDNNGLFIIEGEKVFQFTKENGLFSNSVITLIKDKFGKIWITTDKGIECFEIKNLELFNHQVFTKANGYYLLDPIHPFLDTTGLPYWINGERKLVFNTELTDTKKKAPFLKFIETVVSNDTIRSNNIKIFPNQKISLTYKTIYWGMENNLQLSYLLISNKNDTTERPIQNTDKILLSDILPGNYIVVLKAINNLDVYYSEPINIIVYNFWYNSWIFRISIAIITFFSVISYFRRKAKRQLKINALLEEKVKEQTATIQDEKNALEESLRVIDTQNKEKEILIEEINHRVKNNLQFIIAILEMQMNKQYSNEALQALLGTSRRIKAMSLVHELLYTKLNKTGLSMSSYIYELIDNLKEMAEGSNGRSVNIQLSIDDITLDSRRALAIGMIISELVSNSFKHAFKNILKPQIVIQLKTDNSSERIILTVEDNGHGFIQEESNESGLGRRLVDIFSRQLEGTYELITKEKFRYQLIINQKAV